MHSGGGGRALPSDALEGGVIVRQMTLTLAKLRTSHSSKHICCGKQGVIHFKASTLQLHEVCTPCKMADGTMQP